MFNFSAIQLLTHIYNQTHPIIDTADELDLASPPKRRKPNPTSPKRLISPRKLLKSSEPLNYTNNGYKEPDIDKENNLKQNSVEGNSITRKGKGIGKSSLNNKKNVPENPNGVIENTQNSSKKVVSEVPICKEIECSPEDWVFQKREKAKVGFCLERLVYHNHNQFICNSHNRSHLTSMVCQICTEN